MLLCIAVSSVAASLPAQVKFDFENGSLSGFLQNPESSWMVKDTALLGGSRALQHLRTIPVGAHDVDKISITPRANPRAQSDTWSFSVRYTSSTSVNNYWRAFLASNTDASAMSDTARGIDAYAVGIYNRQGNDTLRLFKINSGVVTPLISANIKTQNKTLAIKVTRSAHGEWTLFANDQGDTSVLVQYGTASDTNEIFSENFGFLFAFTTSNNANFFVDDLSIDVVPRPLKITSVKRRSSRSLLVEVSNPFDATYAVDASRYTLRTYGGSAVAIDSVVPVSAKVVALFVNKSLTTDSYTLTVRNLPNSQGTESADSYSFSLDVPRYGEVVFSELMVRPYSEGQLTNEYIELYNRTNRSINLTGWTIASATRTGRITFGVIEANDYALIGSGVSEFGNTLTVTARPTLTDGGASLLLADSYGVTVAMITYSSLWYANEEKSLGGYSLEKIDLNNFEETAANWRPSDDERGGTPGEENSVLAFNADVTPPELLSFKIAGSALYLSFNEPINDATLNAEDFFLDNSIGAAKSARWDVEKPMDIVLTFDRPLAQNVIYTLSVKSGAICDLAQSCKEDFTLQAGFGEAPAAGDVVINEVLFNPYAGGVDFVEIYNCSDKIAELEKVRIANRNVNNGVISKSYPLPAYALFPRSYVVVTTLPDVVREQYRCPNPEAFITLATLPPYPNEQGCVTLLDSAGATLENFYYSEKMHNGVLTNTKGVSLERINPHRPASETSSWLSAAQASGFATPTGKNSQHSEYEDNSSDAVRLFPETFSPNGDGVDDILFIGYTMPAEGYIANVTIFDAAGRIAKTLCRNVTLAVEGRLSWDGICNNGKVADIGIYVVYVEVFLLSGKINRYKKTCVVGAYL
ncbi:MAG: lamin tail domain-containing protein [Prevotellaceae bacterium]|nr:lamin tail domain-containing protein [Prevotellaceae bacterium]